jgi:hypothetical protein
MTRYYNIPAGSQVLHHDKRFLRELKKNCVNEISANNEEAWQKLKKGICIACGGKAFIEVRATHVIRHTMDFEYTRWICNQEDTLPVDIASLENKSQVQVALPID